MAKASLQILATDVASFCAAHGFILSDHQAAMLARYLELLLKWNQSMNLVGFNIWRDVLDNLVLDSFYLAEFIMGLTLPPVPQIWDLGSGAGLPGIPLRLMWQDGQYWMVEVREKRALFLNTALSRLNLPNTRVFQGQVEKFMPMQQAADLILSRAFMPGPQLLKLVAPFLKPAGLVILLSNLPLEHIPPLWSLTAQGKYLAAKTMRHFSALSLATTANPPIKL